MIAGRFSRRQFLRTGLLGGALLSAASGIAFFATRNPTAAPDEEPWLLLQAQDLPALRALMPVILANRLPEERQARSALIEATLRSADALLFYSSTETHRQVRQILDLLSFPPYRIMFIGLAQDWPDAEEPEVAAFLRRWSNSPVELLQNIVNALTRCIQGAWYALPASSTDTGYPGPPPAADVLRAG